MAGNLRLVPDQSHLERLLAECKETGWGVAIEPDGDGWRFSYIIPRSVDWPGANDYDLQCGSLSESYDIEIAAAAALKPLRDLVAARPSRDR